MKKKTATPTASPAAVGPHRLALAVFLTAGISGPAAASQVAPQEPNSAAAEERVIATEVSPAQPVAQAQLPTADEVQSDPQPAPAAEPEPAPIFEGFEPRALEWFEILSKWGPRPDGSGNQTRSLAWLRRRLQAFGFEVRLESVGELAVGFDRGESSGSMWLPEPVELVFTTPRYSAATPGPARAAARLAPGSLEQLFSQRERLQGSWVVLPYGTSSAAYGELLRSAADMFGLEVLGIVEDGGEPLVAGGKPPETWEMRSSLTHIRLRNDQHDLLLERLESGFEIEVQFDVDNRFSRGPLPLVNLVAELKGSEQPQEWVLIGAPLDSADEAGGAGQAAALASVLESARYLAQLNPAPRRSVRFVLWSGRQSDCFGSRTYVAHHLGELEKICAVLVHEWGAKALRGLRTPREILPFMRELTQNLEPKLGDSPLALMPCEGLDPAQEGDAGSFLRVGVPALLWRSDGEAPEGQYDTRAAVDLDQLQRTAHILALTAEGLANADGELCRRGLLKPGELRLMGLETRYGFHLSGTVVERLDADGWAAMEGWQVGDRVLALGTHRIETRSNLIEALGSGDEDVVTLGRLGQALQYPWPLDGEVTPNSNLPL